MKRIIPWIAPLLLLAFTSAIWACPMCKDSIPNSDAQHQSGVPVGINNSVYLMLTAFLGVLGMITGLIFKAVNCTPVLPPRAGGFAVKNSDSTQSKTSDEKRDLE
jgi:hypothetical protein